MAVLFVHGIGNQRHGSLLTQMAAPVIDALTCAAGTHGYRVTQPTTVAPTNAAAEREVSPRSTVVTLTKGRRVRTVLLVESIWSDCFERPPWWRSLRWALRSLPAAILLLSPDQRDAAAMSPSQAPPRLWSLNGLRRALSPATSLRFVGDDELVLLRFAWRVLVAALLVGALTGTVIAHPPLGAALVLVLLAYLASRRNVVGHVVVAASAPAELRKIRERVSDCLSWTERRAKRVVVVAHSQGGFVSHELLTSSPNPRSPRVAALIGVGSGLKPIWLLRQLNERAVLAAAWISIATIAIGEVLALRILDALTPLLTATATSIIHYGRDLDLPIGLQSRATDPSWMQDARDLPALEIRSLWNAVLGLKALEIAAVGMVATGALVTRRLWNAAYPGPGSVGPGTASAARWIELSSYHDPVGRMLWPTLPAPAEEQSIAVGGHPVRDHVAYFSRRSIVPWRIAESVLTELRLRSPPAIAAVGDTLGGFAERRRRLRAGMFATIIVWSTLPAVVSGTSVIAAIAGVATLLLVTSAALSLAFAAYEGRAQGRDLARLGQALAAGEDVVRLGTPVQRAKRSAPAVLLLALVVLSYSSALYLVGYPTEDSPAPAPLASVATVALGYLLAVGAGYRPPRWWLLASVVSWFLWHVMLVPPVPHAASVPALWAIPGIRAFATAMLLSGIIVHLMRATRLDAGTGSPPTPARSDGAEAFQFC